MNRFIFGFIAALLVLGSIWYFVGKRENKDEILANSAMIQQQIQNVGKLIVTEGYFSQVFTFKNSQNLFLDIVTSDKKALVVANAKATVEYDLRQLETRIDEDNKTVVITKIPEPVINIYPEIEYYDVTQDYFNKFEANDYNKIKNTVTAQFRKKIESSGLKDNAQERLMSELVNIYVLTKSMGWTLMYNEVIIENPEQMKNLKR
ncbi:MULTISPECIES: DUF4230 domain-containing protein [Cognataquiflexum]|jgi:hypothetical protein|uniref:DUF4230 domain-containing protein n=1 Tax=Cognataquiflexum TaxID=3020066 RepID=UPI000DE94240|nr:MULTISPECIES: DUF4230 domain-containing protein [Cognataquiflexum]MCH6234679.1 DUF4230 domain-containing protein [Cognataquiflexum rubidum]